MSLFVRLQSREATWVNTALELTPGPYSGNVYGGPLEAEIAVAGPTGEMLDILRWLGYRVWILNSAGAVVWHGLVSEAAANYGGVEIGVGLEGMVNRVAVAYTVAGGGGSSVRATTAWAEHARSIAVYGTSELLYGGGEMTPTQATALAARLLSERGLPRATVRPAHTYAPGTGTLRCKGLWSTLGWKYYADSAGRAIHSVRGNGEHRLGWAVTGTQFGFRAAGKRIYDLGAHLELLQKDELILVSGSASNNYNFTVDNEAKAEPYDYTSQGITFDPADDIMDANNALRHDRGELIQVSGSSSNNGYFTVKEDGTGHLVVNPATIVTENAVGVSVRIVQGHSVSVLEAVADENPGATVTIQTHGQKIAQTFSHSASRAWSVAEVWLQCMKAGTPGDGLIVEICSDSAGLPGAVLQSATVGAASIPAEMDWVLFPFPNTLSLAASTVFWLVVRRTGTASPENFYWIGTDTDNAYSGTSKRWTGAVWADLLAWVPFEVWGQEDLGAQLRYMLMAGEFFSGEEIRTAVSVAARQWRAGDLTIQDEAEAILDMGTAGGSRLIATVTPEGRAVVDAMPGSDSPPLALNADGRIVDRYGGALGEGVLPVGQWCGLAGIPAHVNDVAVVTPFFIESAEYDPAAGMVRFSVAADEGPWKLGGPGQG